MGIPLERVVPWGRSYDEYVAMFALTEEDLRGRVLDCAGGPSSFCAGAAERGAVVVACDPLYVHPAEAIRRRIGATSGMIADRLRADRSGYLWTHFPDPDALVAARLAAMERFLEDFAAHRHSGRYVAGELPRLPFRTGAFRLALCSHLLFTYSDAFTLEFHLAALRELLRVAEEVRVFPLLNTTGAPSPHLPALQAAHPTTELRPVPYEFQRGANQMLVVKR